MNKWFVANSAVVNLDKTNIMKFITKNSAHSTVHIGYEETFMVKIASTKFVGLQIANHIK